MSETPRYCPDRPLPPYSYVTGLAPHPTRDQRGHSFGRVDPLPQPLDERTYRTNPAYLHGLDLFNHGYYWEAHEAWESLWHAAGRRGPTADFLKGLIKLAAAGVKAREGRPAGIRQHALRSVELIRCGATTRSLVFGLQPAELIAAAEHVAAQADDLTSAGQPDAARRLPVALVLTPR